MLSFVTWCVLALATICLSDSVRDQTVLDELEKPSRILISMSDPTSTKSRTGQMAALAKGLVSRGHWVTLLTPANKGTTMFGENAYSEAIIYDVALEQADIETLKVDLVSTAMGVSTSGQADGENNPVRGVNPISIMNRYLGFFLKSCEGIFGDSTTRRRLEENRFDLLLHDAINPCDYLVGGYLDTPRVTMTSSIRFVYHSEATYAIPSPSSYVPFDLSRSFTDDMTFPQRIINFLSWNLLRPILTFYVFSSFDIIRREYDLSVDQSLSQLSSASLLWLSNSDMALDFAKPMAPHVVLVGGLMVESSKPLPKDLEDFVQGAGKHGVIVFSLGSMVTSLLRDDLNELFAKVFSELPQRVLWRFVGPPPRNLGNNTLLMDWLPQNDLLGHPQTRLLIYHGGINGVYEAIYHKVPMVLLPIFADQPAIGARVTKKGMGLVLDRATLTHGTVKGAILDVINNPKYKASVDRYGSIHHHALASPLDTAVFWIEHVLKFGGSHLRLKGSELNFVVLNSIDVIAFLIVVVTIVLYVDYILLRTCYRCMCSRRKSKSKTD